MKKGTLTLLLFLLSCAGFAQDLNFEVHRTGSNPITKEKLYTVQTLVDVNPGYPASWITDYISAEVSAIAGGKMMKAVSANEVLTAEQKSILKTADLGTDV